MNDENGTLTNVILHTVFAGMSLWNVQGPLLHSGDHIVPRVLTTPLNY